MAQKIYTLLYVIFSFVCIAMVFEACKHDEEVSTGEDIAYDKTTLVLKWNIAYAQETREKAETGLLWALSYLGAELPKGAFEQACEWNQNKVTIHFDKLGFSEQGLQALSSLVLQFQQTEEFKKTGAIDLGRFVALTINSSNHYYAIVGMPKNFTSFINGKLFDKKRFVATNSTVSISNDRIIDLPDSNNTSHVQDAYVSNECVGRLSNGENEIVAYEVFDHLPNGQLKFAIYDTTGQLLTTAKGAAGKTAKCLWCHEIYISPLFTTQTDFPGYYGAEEFNRIIARNMLKLNNYRDKLSSDIDFSQKQNHTFMELLYISFMEPSAQRLAMEWGISVDEVKDKLKGLSTHVYSEFPFLGDLYYRDQVEPFAPFTSLKPPSSAREKSEYEPDLIK